MDLDVENVTMILKEGTKIDMLTKQLNSLFNLFVDVARMLHITQKVGCARFFSHCILLPSLTPLSGHPVCREAWLRFLGLGKNRLRRTKKRHRGQDERSLKCGYLFKHINLLINCLINSLIVFPNKVCWMLGVVTLCLWNGRHLRTGEQACNAVSNCNCILYSLVLDGWGGIDNQEAWLNV